MHAFPSRQLNHLHYIMPNNQTMETKPVVRLHLQLTFCETLEVATYIFSACGSHDIKNDIKLIMQTENKHFSSLKEFEIDG